MTHRTSRGVDGSLVATGRIEPFPSRHEPASLPALRAALDARAALRATLESLSPATLDDEAAATVESVNTPEALAEAARRLGSSR